MIRSKRYRAAKELVENRSYSISEACELVKKTASAKFDQSIELVFNLNLDTKQADQQLRGTIILPNGNGKTKKILALSNTKQQEATEAGADIVGGKELVEKIEKESWFDYDVIVATPDMMGFLGKIGRILGPKGLMPNPKTGTVTMEIGKAISEIKKGKIEYRTDKQGNIALVVGKSSFETEKLVENIKAVMDLILRVKPNAVKGTYIKGVHISSTMGPSIKLVA